MLPSNGHIVYDSICTVFSEWPNYEVRWQISGCQGFRIAPGRGMDMPITGVAGRSSLWWNSRAQLSKMKTYDNVKHTGKVSI